MNSSEHQFPAADLLRGAQQTTEIHCGQLKPGEVAHPQTLAVEASAGCQEGAALVSASEQNDHEEEASFAGDAGIVGATNGFDGGCGAPIIQHTSNDSSGADDGNDNDTDGDDEARQVQRFSFLERQARRCARWPKTHLFVSLGIAVVLSAIGMVFGDFTITVENVGWPSRGTLIANRQTQNLLISRNDGPLSRTRGKANDLIWEDLTTNVQPGWETRRYEKRNNKNKNDNEETDDIPSVPMVTMAPTSSPTSSPTLAPTSTGNGNKRKNVTELVDQCDVELYMKPSFLHNLKLWPVWQVASTTSSDTDSVQQASATDPKVLEDLCLAEEKTQRVLEEEGLCYGCNDDTECLPPYGIVLYARFVVPYGLSMNCSTLAASWEPYRDEEEAKWQKCVAYLRRTAGDLDDMDSVERNRYCPPLFSPALVDEWFEQTGRVQYTSTLFVTYGNWIDELYEVSEDFGRGTPGIIEGTYDTQIQSFIELYANDSIVRDTTLSFGAAIITMFAMMVHTRSPFLTLVGLFQIVLGFPLSYFVYRFVLGLSFYPFLNLVGVFVIFALGADHVFVAVDKWKNVRNDHPCATTEEVAGMALPSAGRAMILTTITTAVAFFGSALCPVTPIVLFATFSGMLIVIDYILDVVVMFPCLCIYDSFRFQRNYCMDFRHERNQESQTEEHSSRDSEIEAELTSGSIAEEKTSKEDEIHAVSKRVAHGGITTMRNNGLRSPSELDADSSNLIRRILHGYYNLIHSWRWALLILSAIALGLCAYFATTLQVPDTPTEIQLLASDVEYEKNREWRANLLLDSLLKESGSIAQVDWGVKPADTGDHLDPFTWSTLVLDETFEPSSIDSQEYLKDFCQSLYEQEFADPVGDDSVCAINQFDEWLQTQSEVLPELQDANYVEYCNESTGLPVNPEIFHGCLTAWSQEGNRKDILSWNGTVKIIRVNFKTKVRFNSPSKELGEQWRMIEKWMQTKQAEEAPVEVSRAFFSNMDWWWWDTTENVYQTAINSGAIAIAVSAVVILVTSRSLLMTFFSSISVVYVLVSVTAVMSAAGWTLGFLESVCFTILIGLSGDFVIHFSHAYTELSGNRDRGERTKYALIHLGPSMLAAGFTTLAGAAVMLFAIVYFLHLFALVLFFTIVQATIGSFVVFLVLADCMGPSDPTYTLEYLTAKFGSFFKCWRDRDR